MDFVAKLHEAVTKALVGKKHLLPNDTYWEEISIINFKFFNF